MLNFIYSVVIITVMIYFLTNISDFDIRIVMFMYHEFVLFFNIVMFVTVNLPYKYIELIPGLVFVITY